MSASEVASAYQQHLITANEALEQAGVESIEQLLQAARRERGHAFRR
ncbi:hypothetical protein [Mangrovibrevibacter kandeliae]|nr:MULTISPECIES: hypothetical protein [unclassified Aurantimonas]MCQ8782461.1 hypothetical protein [Aurantimonas sp. CSK15Z-1]MCW4114796.1 hypothetical protein [Aurantimonas sp. MSK8Z-1]